MELLIVVAIAMTLMTFSVWALAKAAHKENTIRLSYKSQVAMYISKGIHIETTAEFKCCKTVPFLGHDWPKLWDQVNALNN